MIKHHMYIYVDKNEPFVFTHRINSAQPSHNFIYILLKDIDSNAQPFNLRCSIISIILLNHAIYDVQSSPGIFVSNSTELIKIK